MSGNSLLFSTTSSEFARECGEREYFLHTIERDTGSEAGRSGG
jgi:hypothetical protein